MNLNRILISIISLLLVSGCSLLPSSTEGDYEKSRANPKLEEPPEISLPTPSAAYQIPKASAPKISKPEKSKQERSETDPSDAKVELNRDGSLRWLTVPMAADKLWPLVLEFWKEADVKLAESDDKLGMLETEWVESKAGIPTEGLKDLLKKAVGSDSDLALRDRYRVRVRAKGDTALVFLTHRGAVLTHAGGDTPHWEMRQPEPEREAEMLRRLQLFLSHR